MSTSFFFAPYQFRSARAVLSLVLFVVLLLEDVSVSPVVLPLAPRALVSLVPAAGLAVLVSEAALPVVALLPEPFVPELLLEPP